jgi:hypothetical protein
VYSRGHTPQLLPKESGITKPSISVVMADGAPILHQAARVYYGITYPIQYNVKVKEIGYIHPTEITRLISNWRTEDQDDFDKPLASAVVALYSKDRNDEGDMEMDYSITVGRKKESQGEKRGQTQELNAREEQDRRVKQRRNETGDQSEVIAIDTDVADLNPCNLTRSVENARTDPERLQPAEERSSSDVIVGAYAKIAMSTATIRSLDTSL